MNCLFEFFGSEVEPKIPDDFEDAYLPGAIEPVRLLTQGFS